jgi:hypothetical protein
LVSGTDQTTSSVPDRVFLQSFAHKVALALSALICQLLEVIDLRSCEQELFSNHPPHVAQELHNFQEKRKLVLVYLIAIKNACNRIKRVSSL